jgi:glycosyltransferase involved in cell wall biosynthesis
MNKKIKVIGVFNLFPHYRKAIYDRLIHSDDIEFFLCSGEKSVLPSLTVYAGTDLPDYTSIGRYQSINNVWLGEHFLWQQKVAWPSFYRNFDVMIHTGSMYQLSTWAALLSAKLTKTRSLLWTHGLPAKDSFLKRIIRCTLYRLADGVLLYGHASRQRMIEQGLPPEKLYVIYNSLNYGQQKQEREQVNLGEVEKLKAQLFSNPSLPTLIYIGRLTAEKEPLLMVDLCERMRTQKTPVNILVVGDGPEFGAMQQAVSKHNLTSNIALFGACHEESELAKLMTASDIALMPGYVGLSAMHYMAYGLAVLTTDDLDNQKPEVEAIIDGVTGGFYRHRDVVSLASEVSRWLEKVGAETRAECIKQIERFYNPQPQYDIILHACRGLPATQQPHMNNPGFASHGKN